MSLEIDEDCGKSVRNYVKVSVIESRTSVHGVRTVRVGVRAEKM